jgi:hypothetical protein
MDVVLRLAVLAKLLLLLIEGRFGFSQKFLAGQLRRTFQRRKGRVRPVALEVRLAVGCSRLAPGLRRLSFGLRPALAA